MYYWLVGEVMGEFNMLPLVGIYLYIGAFGGSKFLFFSLFS